MLPFLVAAAAYGAATRPVLRSVPVSRHTGAPIFISGCNRGGTTILAQLLAAHPEVRNVGRGPFCEGQYLWRRRFRDWSRHRWAVGPWRPLLRRTAEHATPELVEFFRSTFEQAMDGPGRMLEKTPANAVRIPLIDRIYPDCHFVHVLRDGRHTTASLVARRVLLPVAPYQWVGVHRTALADLAALRPERVTLVRFEELAEDPERVLRKICDRCGLAWGAPERDRMTAAVLQYWRPPEDRWARFSPLAKRYVLSVIGDLQRELGYPAGP
jgi:hypothetical protein